jgi:hypothetical protein
MLDSMYIAATGMHAEQAQIDTVANNLVNMNTVGFKKSRVAFATLMPEPTTPPSIVTAGAEQAAAYQGVGVAGTNLLADFAAGSLKQNKPWANSISPFRGAACSSCNCRTAVSLTAATAHCTSTTKVIWSAPKVIRSAP